MPQRALWPLAGVRDTLAGDLGRLGPETAVVPAPSLQPGTNSTPAEGQRWPELPPPVAETPGWRVKGLTQPLLHSISRGCASSLHTWEWVRCPDRPAGGEGGVSSK